MDQELSGLDAHVGRTATATDVVTASAVAQLAATLGIEPPAVARGEPLPPGWHVPFFVPVYGPSHMRRDGQAAGGGFMPDVPLPRQRLRGDRYEFLAPLHIGDEMTRHSEIAEIAVADETGGPVVTLVLEHRIEGPRGLAVVENREFFYHGETAPPSTPPEITREAAWRETVDPDPVLLFRYSAVRFNSHRIHFDRDFAVREEGLPGLVVQGTLVAQLLLEMCRTALPDRRIASFAYRIHRPIFDTGPFVVCGAPSPDRNSASLWAIDPEDRLAMTAEALLAE